MATNLDEQQHEIVDLSGGVQRRTTMFVGKATQVRYASNATFVQIGGVQKVKGHRLVGNTITTSSTTSTTTSSTTSTTTSTSSSSTSSSTTSTSSTTTP